MEDQNIKDAQYRKSLSISFFNATNNATQLAEIMMSAEDKKDPEKVKATVKSLRDWLLVEHRDYYATTIANAGENFKVEETIAKLKKATTLFDLKKKWLELSQDERNNEEIINCIADMKEKIAGPIQIEAPAESEEPKAEPAPKVEKVKKPKKKKNETTR